MSFRRGEKWCSFCGRARSQEEIKKNPRLCHECFYLRHIITGMGWQGSRSPFKGRDATIKEISRWLRSGLIPEDRRVADARD